MVRGHGGGREPELGGFTMDRFAPGEAAGYPTLCKGRFAAGDRVFYLFEDPVSLNAVDLLVSLHRAGVAAFKIEGRQRGKAYVAQVVRAFRAALDSLQRGEAPATASRLLAGLAEGGRETTGAYRKIWR